jgi:flagellar biosynthesis/type III secretory pathway protein FliH
MSFEKWYVEWASTFITIGARKGRKKLDRIGELQEAYEAGLNEGEEIGYWKGKDYGYDTGYEYGRADGRDDERL